MLPEGMVLLSMLVVVVALGLKVVAVEVGRIEARG